MPQPLSLNAVGQDVANLQGDLDKLEIQLPESEVQRRVFGVGTRAAVLALQRRFGLEVTGTVDESTLRAIQDAVAVTDNSLGRVEGRVLTEDGAVARGAVIRLYRHTRDAGAEKLGEASADEEGFYAIPWMNGRTQEGQYELRLAGSEGKEIPIARLEPSLANYVAVNLVAPTRKLGGAEFPALSEAVGQALGGIDKLGEVREEGDRRDISILREQTGWDARLIALAASAERLSKESGLTRDASYALLRAGLPSDPTALAAAGALAVEFALKKARESSVVAMDDAAAAAARDTYAAFAQKTLPVAKGAGQLAAPRDFYAAAGLDDAQRETLERLYFVDQLRGDVLWAKASEQGLADKVGALRTQGRLALLTQSNALLTASLEQRLHGNDLQSLVDQGFHKDETWEDHIRDLAGNNPANLAALVPPGQDNTDAAVAKRLKDYSRQLAGTLRLNFPTKVAAQWIKEGEIRIADGSDAVKKAAATVLSRASSSGIELDTHALAPAMRDEANRAEWFAGVAPDVVATVEEGLKSYQRVRQITPDDESARHLLDDGIGSASEVVALGRKGFVDRFAERLQRTVAELVFKRATQIRAVTYNLFNGINELQQQPALFAASPPPADDGHPLGEARDNLLLSYPTLRSLIGSLDSADCLDCRSAVSPAAYLVDLLRLLDPPQAAWEEFLKAWPGKHGGEKYEAKYKNPYSALKERRPDIANLPLTCENTETSLPHIDLVNEILEFAAAKGGLTEDAAHDTGDALSEDLIAEPRNVMREAYDLLGKARYPSALPFDLWLETSRAFFEQAGTSLWKALDAMRRTDELGPPQEGKGPAYGREAIFAERLGIGPKEFATLTPANALGEWHLLYGFDDANKSAAENQADARSALDASASELARRLGVSYFDLVDLARTWFVNPALDALPLLPRMGLDAVDIARLKGQADFQPLSAGEKASIEARIATYSAAHAVRGFDAGQWIDDSWNAGTFGRLLVLKAPPTSNFSKTRLTFLGGAPADDLAYAKLALFVCLKKRLGWTIHDLDRALRTLIPSSLRPAHADLGGPAVTADTLGPAMRAAILHLSHAKALVDTLQLAREGGPAAVASFWTDIDTGGADPLYARLFLKPGTTGVDPTFDHPLGAYLTATALRKPFSWKSDAPEDLAAGNVGLRNHLGPVLAGLRLTAAEIETVLAAANGLPQGGGSALDAAALNLATLSLLHRHAVLSRAIRLPVDQLVTLARITGLDPFAPIGPAMPVAIAEDAPFSQTMAFVQAATELRDAGLSPDDLNWLLRHRFDPNGRNRPDPAAGVSLMRTLGGELTLLQAEHEPADPLALTDERLASELALALPPAAADQFMSMWTGRVVLEATRPGVAPADKLDPNLLKNEPALRVEYKAGSQSQRLAHTGMLTIAELQRIKQAIPQPQLLHDMLDELTGIQALIVTRDFAFIGLQDVEPLFGLPAPDADEAALQRRERDRRALLGQRLMPFVRGRLTRARIVESTATSTGADRGLAEALLTDASVLAAEGGGTVADILIRTSQRGLDAWFKDDPDLGGQDPAPILLASADTKPQRPQSARSARIEGWIEVRQGGAHSFTVDADNPGCMVQLTIGDGADPLLRFTADANAKERTTGPVDLRQGTAYRFSLTARSMDGGEVRVLVASDALPRSGLDALVLYPADAERAARRAATRVAKALRLAGAIGLGEAEIRHLSSHAEDFENFSLSSLPLDAGAAEDAAAPQLFRGLRVLLAYQRLRGQIVGGSTDLIALMRLAHRRFPDAMPEQDASATALLDLVDRFATLSRRPRDTIARAADWLGPWFDLRMDQGERVVRIRLFSHPFGIARLWDVLQLANTMRAPVTALAEWVRPDPDADIAGKLRDATRAAFAPDGWRIAAKPIFDTLRRRRRDALVAHLMHRERFEQPERLFEAYLIDTGMEPVVLTSRVQLAISAVQTFIQRCLLNLEPTVHPSAIDSARWEWMRRYRVWDANRRIFLFPENWLEPEFRDDKSHLFRQLEGTLLQGDVTDEGAEAAFLIYLRGLEEIARLEVVAMWSEVNPANVSRGRLHVLARTATAPRRHYYRTASGGMWQPWAPVDVDIEGDLACVVTWRGRVYVFWVTFVEQPTQPPAGTIESAAKRTPSELAPSRRVQYRLNWSELVDGTWAGPFGANVNGGTITVPAGWSASTGIVRPAKEYDEEGDERAVLIIVGDGGTAIRTTTPNASPRLVGLVMGSTAGYSVPYELVAGTGAVFTGTNDLHVKFVADASSVLGAPMKGESKPQTILAKPGRDAGGYAVVTAGDPYAPPASEFGPLIAPFFYQDADNTFFAEPDLTVKTLVTHNDWVPVPVEGVPQWRLEDWWKTVPIEVQVPNRPPRIPVDPGDPAPWVGAGGEVFQKAPGLIGPQVVDAATPFAHARARDWVTAPGTLVAFGERVVGSTGGLDLVRLAAGAPGLAADAGALVAVQPGLAAALGEAVVPVTLPAGDVGRVVLGVASGGGIAAGPPLAAGARLDGAIGHVVGGGGFRPEAIKVVARGAASGGWTALGLAISAASAARGRRE
jgi:hypothetical protein